MELTDFPKYIKAKRYKRKKQENENERPSWEILPQNHYIRTSDITFFYRWPGNPTFWVVKWYDYNSKHKKVEKWYLVDDPDYLSYFAQYDTKPRRSRNRGYLSV